MLYLVFGRFLGGFCMFNFFLFCALTLSASLLTSSEVTQQEYFNLIEKYPHLIYPRGDASKGEIQIILDQKKMNSIEQETGKDVGIFLKDSSELWINDACLFSDGKTDVVQRTFRKEAEAALLPVLPNEKIALLCKYHHGARSWSLELPQARIQKGETLELSLLRSAKEEIGVTLGQLQLLGNMSFDSKGSSNLFPIFTGRILDQDLDVEAPLVYLTLKEIKAAFKKGFHVISIQGEEKKVLFRNSILAYALVIYEESLRGAP